MATSVNDISLSMIAQLRLLDPSISADLGTPERKLLDTFASALHDSQIDLDALSSQLDIDSKYGAGLDRFVNIFNFARKKATYATGFVTFSRLTASNLDIRIPANTMVVAPNILTSFQDRIDISFFTLFDVVLPAGDLTVSVPIRSIIAGENANVAANTITQIIGTPVFGITGVTNEATVRGGQDSESDEELKVRFKNTVFRNLAGTQDQYMALAISTPFTTKANVLGPISHYREYVQVPPVADNDSYDVDGAGAFISITGNGLAGIYTSALSAIPFAKHIYVTEVPSFVSNGTQGIGTVFYREGYDFTLNLDNTARNKGDTYRFGFVGLDVTPVAAPYRPNVSFTNVYTGADGDVTAIRPSDVVLLEFSYLSEASRNNVTQNITNAVDVFIDSNNTTLATTVVPRPSASTLFVDNSTSRYHYENYRRVGDPIKRPTIGNSLQPLFWEPVIDLPAQIVIGTDTYYKNVHYWAVEDVSNIGGTVRARNGIEWSTKVYGRAAANALSTNPATYTGKIATNSAGDPVGGTTFTIENYSYDRNVVDLQAALEGAKQVTTDILAHRATKRYFKLDVTVMYTQGASISETNIQIQEAVDRFLQNRYFGSVIQLSDLLQVIHNVSGVDNVRWSSDTPNNLDLTRVFECDINGNPLLGVSVERVQPGSGSRQEIQYLFITGEPTDGTFKLTWNNSLTPTFDWNTTAATIESFISGLGTTVTVTEDTRSNTGVDFPIRSFRIAWTTAVGNGTSLSGEQPVIAVAEIEEFVGGPFIFESDFFLRDNELASLPAVALGTDTVAGLIIRPRAQNTWTRG